MYKRQVSKYDINVKKCEDVWRRKRGGKHAFKLDKEQSPATTTKTTTATPSVAADTDTDDDEFPHDAIDDYLEDEAHGSNTTIGGATTLLQQLYENEKDGLPSSFLYDDFTIQTQTATRARRKERKDAYAFRGCQYCDRDIITRPDNERIRHIKQCRERAEVANDADDN